METINFNFDTDQFDKLFPFHILCDRDGLIKSLGKSLTQNMPSEEINTFSDSFFIKRPSTEFSWANINLTIDQKVVIQQKSGSKLVMQGQFLYLDERRDILFVGSPWLESMDMLAECNLGLHDFAIHDPMIYLLHLLKTEAMTTRQTNQLLTQVNLQRSTLKKNEEKYRRIIENMKLGLSEMTLDGDITYVNQNFCDISGFLADELISANVHDLVLYENYPKAASREKLASRGVGTSDSYEVKIKNKQGDDRWWLSSGAPNYNEAGELIGSIGIHLDITEQKRLEAESVHARTKAEESAKAKEHFLANMSHEIRTPLNAVIGMLRELHKMSPTNKQLIYLDHARSASQHLLSIINNILDVSKIDAGEFQLDVQTFSLRTLLNETQAIMLSSARDKLLTLKYVIAPDVPDALIGDPGRIRQIILNIVSNAIKFTDKGSIELKCLVAQVDEAEHKIKISINDTGIGMDQDYLKKLFNKFSQEDPSIVRKYGGTGLGMAITYELIQMMQGNIEVRSEKGIGSTFEFCITLKPGNANDIEKHLLEQHETRLKGLKVLLVEDNEINRLVATNSLSHYGMDVREATNGLEAIEVLRHAKFDLILMDLQMPFMGGLQATEIIRDELKIHTPIVGLTATAFKNKLEKCISAGMNDYIIKPFEESTLLQVILRNTQENVNGAEYRLYDLSQLNKLSHGNEEFVGKIVQMFCTNVPDSIQTMKSSYQGNDISTLANTAHKLKPLIDSFGIACLHEDIRKLESLSDEPCEMAEVDHIIDKVDHVITRVIAGLSENKMKGVA